MPQDRGIKWFQNGQPRPYTDTLRVFEVNASDEADAESAIRELGYRTKNKIAASTLGANGHNGGCSNFPFGMESFYSVKEEKSGRWLCRITEPYTG